MPKTITDTDAPGQMDEGTVTFLPMLLAKDESPLTQYLPLNSLDPEQQTSACYLFDGLSDQQQKFILAYIQNWNLAKAKEAAGYAEEYTAHERFKLKVLDPLDQLLSLLRHADRSFLAKKSGITRTRWIEEVKATACFDPVSLMMDDGKVKPLKELSRQTRRALRIAVKSHTRFGDEFRYVPYDKQAALRMLGEALGFLDQVQDTAPAHKTVEIVFVKSEEQSAAVIPAISTTTIGDDLTMPTGCIIKDNNKFHDNVEHNPGDTSSEVPGQMLYPLQPGTV